jgi:hypothetical protein
MLGKANPTIKLVGRLAEPINGSILLDDLQSQSYNKIGRKIGIANQRLNFIGCLSLEKPTIKLVGSQRLQLNLLDDCKQSYNKIRRSQ